MECQTWERFGNYSSIYHHTNCILKELLICDDDVFWMCVWPGAIVDPCHLVTDRIKIDIANLFHPAAKRFE